jgi:hypothetical protein
MLGGAADAADTPAQRLAVMAGAYIRFAVRLALQALEQRTPAAPPTV